MKSMNCVACGLPHVGNSTTQMAIISPLESQNKLLFQKENSSTQKHFSLNRSIHSCAQAVHNVAKAVINTVDVILKNNDAFINLVKLFSSQLEIIGTFGARLPTSITTKVTETCQSYLILGSIKNVIHNLGYFVNGNWLVQSHPDGESYLLNVLGRIAFGISDLIWVSRIVSEKKLFPESWHNTVHSIPVFGMALQVATGSVQALFGVIGFGMDISNISLRAIRNKLDRKKALALLIEDIARVTSIILNQFEFFPCKVLALVSSSVGNLIFLGLFLFEKGIKPDSGDH